MVVLSETRTSWKIRISHQIDYDSFLSLYVTTPFSIKSGISTANHGDNCWKCDKKRHMFTVQFNLFRARNLISWVQLPPVPLHVQFRISVHFSPTAVWNGRSNRFYRLDTFWPFSHPIRAVQFRALLLGM